MWFGGRRHRARRGQLGFENAEGQVSMPFPRLGPSCKGTELKCECFVIQIMLTNVAKELKDNQHILKSLQSTAMPPIQKNSIVPEKQASKVGDTLEIILMAPLKSDFFASTTEIKVSPTNHHWNCGSITSLSSPFLPISSRWSWEGGGLCGGKVLLEVAWPWAWVGKLVPFWRRLE